MQPTDAIVVPLILGLVEVAKQLGLPARFAPALALALGVVAGVLYVSPGDPVEGVLVGLVMGLAAVGLWSGPKNLVRSDA
jgi:hypothetical protein